MSEEHEQGLGDEPSAAAGGNATNEAEHRRCGQDEVLVEALAAGMTYAAAGNQAGVSPRTVARRMSDTAFTARVAARRGEYLSVVTGQLATMGTEALQAIRAGLGAEKPADSLQAARLILSFGLRFRNETDVESRLADFARRLGDRMAASAPEGTPD